MELYRVIFLGLAVAGPDEEARLIKGLQKKFDLSPERAESLVQRVPIVVKKGVSKAEIERYVRAFQEIGGRVRVEREPVAETLEAPAEPTQGPEAGRGDVAYPEGGRSQGEEGKEISSEGGAVPWESGEGFIRAFFRTAWEALFSPIRFFEKVGKGEGYWPPLIYGAMIGIIGRFLDLFWAWLLIIPLVPPNVRNLMVLPYALFIMVIVFAMPLMVAISILVWSCVIHLILIMIGGNRRGFEVTFRAISYAYSARFFHIVPFIGSTVGSFYRIVLFILGIREGHGIGTGRAVLSVLLPLILAIVLFIAVLLPFFVKSTGFFGGLRM
ncbi:MAG: YIP1 family protein [Syntrophaceae bacterium]|nr:YIP1 family protein [Syntrophaceae bacterium]